MVAPMAKSAVPLVPQSSLDHLKRTAADTPDERRDRLRRAAKEFESLFYYQILKTMRKTVPDSPLSQGGPVSGGAGKDIFMDLFDQELSKNVNAGGPGSLAEILYSQLEQTLDGDVVSEGVREGRVLPLDGNEKGGLSRQREPLELGASGKAVPIRPERPAFRSVAPPQFSAPADSIVRRYGKWIDEAAKENNLDSALIWAVIKVESGGDPTAESSAGAKGLMQLIDTTAEEMGVKSVFDARENIAGGSRYLRRMLDRFGDLKLALAAYNAGPGAVARFQGVPPYAETREYVERVTELLAGHAEGISDGKTQGR
jgi:Rod binding domain-containing protein